MDPAFAWAIVGLVLVIAELLSGTFYLLMLAIAAFGAAGVAYLGQAFPVQCIVALVIEGALPWPALAGSTALARRLGGAGAAR